MPAIEDKLTQSINNMKNKVLQIVLALVIIVFAFLIYRSIDKPLKFEAALKTRGDVVVEKLKDIRTAQTLFKSIHSRYTTSFDTLEKFVMTGKIPVVKMMPDPKDTTNTRTIRDTIGFVSIFDSIYAKKNYKLEDFDLIPFAGGDKFEMTAGMINKGGVNVPVFEVLAPFEAYTKGLPEQLVINRKKESEDIGKFPGLKVGSMVEASTDGNWE
jgi:hypothetical protein